MRPASTQARHVTSVTASDTARMETMVAMPFSVGTEGATIRIYLERYVADATQHGIETQTALAPITVAAAAISDVAGLTGRAAPSVIS